ncbi:MAG: cation:proton antiporter [Clostridia bacterium]|jgi:Kef-type K+ transport system membrane component KefB|nr:cation:proton antiporter [Clostridia bacterium]
MNGVFLIDNGLGFVAVLAIILLFTKLFGLLFRKIGLPQVLGYIIAGIVIGPAIFGDWCGFSLIGTESDRYHCLFLLSGTEDGAPFALGKDGLLIFSKIGVLLLMFSTGLETDLRELKKTGLAASLIACAGVAAPMVLGIVISLPFGGIGLGTANIYRCVFIGAILTATSVAITVSVLKELGKISTKLGTTIISAAIIDDVIGIIVLSVVTGIAKAGAAEAVGGFAGFKATIYGTIIMIVVFFIVAIGLGFGISKLFRWMEIKWPKTRRLSIFSLVVCFLYAWAAEEIFGVADITGAFLAGLILSTTRVTRDYTDRKVEINTYTLFAPVFFANIGISNITFVGMSGMVILFAFLAVIMGLLGKIVGCGTVAKGFKYNLRESSIAGVGMMARGEVALIVTATAMNPALGENALPAQFMIMTVLLILVSSILTPILLKWLYGKEPKTPAGGISEESAPLQTATESPTEPVEIADAPANE